jgi:dipeptidyl aminopeptidase/acylaminoacyl peptidase
MFIKYVLFLLLILSALASESKNLTLEMIMDIKSISNPKISPDGKFVAYLKIIPPSADEGKKYRFSELNIMNLSSKEIYPIKKIHSSSSASPIKYQWSRDSRNLYFSAIYEEYHSKKQVYKISIENHKPQLISKDEEGIGTFIISKNEKYIYFLGKVKRSQQEQDLINNGHDWVINEQQYNYTYLFCWDIEKSETYKISPDSLHVFSFELEPNNNHIIYQAATQGKSDYSYMFRDIYRIVTDGSENKKLVEHDGKLGKMTISPDGKYLAFLGAVDISDPTDGSLLFAKIGQKAWKNLTAEFEGSLTDIDWIDNETIVFCAETFNHTSVYKININNSKTQQLFGNEKSFKAIDLAANNDQFVCSANAFNHPAELYTGSLNQNKIIRITDSNPELKEIDFIKPKEFVWDARDGEKVQGFIYKPAKFTANATSPLCVYVHGGPESARQTGWNNHYNNWPQILAQKGAVVFIPNYRGSTGRGVQFAKADQGDMMGVDFDDVLDGIDALIEKKWVDASKVGIYGGSYGGYMAAWASTKYSDRFKAAVMFAGISNQVSKIGTTDTPHENALVHWIAYPWDSNFNLLWERSPLKYFKNHKTPILIAHGEIDERVPSSQAYELYRALNHIEQAPVKLIIYPDEKHGLRKRSHRYHYMINALNWFDTYLFSNN